MKNLKKMMKHVTPLHVIPLHNMVNRNSSLLNFNTNLTLHIELSELFAFNFFTVTLQRFFDTNNENFQI